MIEYIDLEIDRRTDEISPSIIWKYEKEKN